MEVDGHLAKNHQKLPFDLCYICRTPNKSFNSTHSLIASIPREKKKQTKETNESESCLFTCVVTSEQKKNAPSYFVYVVIFFFGCFYFYSQIWIFHIVMCLCAPNRNTFAIGGTNTREKTAKLLYPRTSITIFELNLTNNEQYWLCVTVYVRRLYDWHSFALKLPSKRLFIRDFRAGWWKSTRNFPSNLFKISQSFFSSQRWSFFVVLLIYSGFWSKYITEFLRKPKFYFVIIIKIIFFLLFHLFVARGDL